MTPTLPLRLRLSGTGGEGRGRASIGHLLHARHCHTAFLESSNDPVGGSGEKTGPEGSRPPWATFLRGSPPSFLSCRDRKKKRFVGQSGQEDKKKIKTESGRYISSSYKQDLYPEDGG